MKRINGVPLFAVIIALCEFGCSGIERNEHGATNGGDLVVNSPIEITESLLPPKLSYAIKLGEEWRAGKKLVNYSTPEQVERIKDKLTPSLYRKLFKWSQLITLMRTKSYDLVDRDLETLVTYYSWPTWSNILFGRPTIADRARFNESITPDGKTAEVSIEEPSSNDGYCAMIWFCKFERIEGRWLLKEIAGHCKDDEKEGYRELTRLLNGEIKTFKEHLRR
jgi:hypothetical protein